MDTELGYQFLLSDSAFLFADVVPRFGSVHLDGEVLANRKDVGAMMNQMSCRMASGNWKLLVLIVRSILYDNVSSFVYWFNDDVAISLESLDGKGVDKLMMDFPVVVLVSTVVPEEAWFLLLVTPGFSSLLFLVC
eukprot:g36579.t1